MNTWIKTSAFIFGAAFIGITAVAQDTKEKDKTKKTEKNQEIVIRQSGDKTEKTTIVIDGENVTINGKPLSEYKGDDLTVTQRSGSTSFSSPRARVAGRGGFQAFDDEHSNKALLGVTTEKVADGAKITELSKESAAEKSGLKEGDVITKVGDKKIESHEDLVAAISSRKPNEKVDITYKRDGKESKTTATLGENKMKSFSFNSDDFNFKMPDIPNFNGGGNNFFNPRNKPKIGLQIQDVEEGKGVKVKEVDDNSPALKAGFKQGDVITAVNGKEVNSVDELREEIKDVKDGDTVKFTYARSGKSQTVDLKIPKKLKTADL